MFNHDPPKRANQRREQLAGPGHFDVIPQWSPNQLRHSFAEYVRTKFGIEAAGASLGHDQLTTTLIYAEKDVEREVEVAKQIG